MIKEQAEACQAAVKQQSGNNRTEDGRMQNKKERVRSPLPDGPCGLRLACASCVYMSS
ncbi:hypothetical protein SCFA_40032 [anaerobic digester metagenome]|uniref:Uncharacterized protein n=1 Tax=anaerobic digester metagenome TaxID=1263854 RepID=A0A485M1D0_9ZZZZ